MLVESPEPPTQCFFFDQHKDAAHNANALAMIHENLKELEGLESTINAGKVYLFCARLRCSSTFIASCWTFGSNHEYVLRGKIHKMRINNAGKERKTTASSRSSIRRAY